MKIISWIGSQINGLLKDMNRHRSILCWVYSTAYLVLVRYCVLHNPSTMNTAIMTTGGVCGTIFSAWVIGSAHVSATQIRYPAAPGTGGNPTDMTDPGF